MFKRRTKPKVSADYIVGLTDGEGCFYVRAQPPFNKAGGSRIQLNFFIKIQQADKSILEKVKKALGCGMVYFQKETRANHAQCYRYTVSSHRDIMAIIIPFFQTHPLQGKTKQNNFKLFCKIAKLVDSGKHLSSKGLNQILYLKSQMNLRTRVVR